MEHRDFEIAELNGPSGEKGVEAGEGLGGLQLRGCDANRAGRWGSDGEHVGKEDGGEEGGEEAEEVEWGGG